MKKLLLIAMCIFMSTVCRGQYYNPYGSFQQQQMNQQAFEWGKKMMEQAQRNQEQQLKQNPLLLGGTAVSEMAAGQYSKAYEHFEYLAEEYNDKNSWLYLGYMNELGMGTTKSYSYAETCYENGAELGEPNCKKELLRIQRGEYLGNEFKKTLRSYFQNIVSMTNSSIGGNNNFTPRNNGGTSNGSFGNSQYTCPTCHGTRHCTMCAGRGYYQGYNGYIECSMCHGGGLCYGCKGKGYIR